MNRKSLFGRLTASTIVSRNAERQEYLRLHLEPLEQRKLLTTTPTYVNDNWFNMTSTDGTTYVGDFVQNLNDTLNAGAVVKQYGIDAFGSVTTWDDPNIGGNEQSATLGYHPLAANFGLIHHAIQGTDVGGTLNILEGTYIESDIFIDHSMNVIGAGNSPNDAVETLIIPEVASSNAAPANFTTGSHSGIFIYSADVTVRNLRVDGNANATVNTGAGHSQNFHQGITTLYDTQGGGNYTSQRGITYAPIQLGTLFSTNRSRANIAVEDVTVDNTFYHGITLSALAGQQWGTSAGSGQNVDNAIVRNVGVAGGQTKDNIGILIQNVDNNPFPGPNDGNVRFSSVTNAGTGISTNAFGNKTYASQAGARNLTGVVGNTVTNAAVYGYWIEFADGGEGKRGNTATWTTANSATGLYLNRAEALLTGWVINGAKTGVHIQNTPLTVGDQVIMGIGGNVLTGPGTGTPGSVGILINNSATETENSNGLFTSGTTISGYEIGLMAEMGFTDANPGNGSNIIVTMSHPAFGVNGTGIVAGNGVIIQGNDPAPSLVTTGSATIRPTYDNWDNYFQNNPGNSGQSGGPAGPPIFTSPKADILNVGNLSLSSSSTYQPLLTGETGTTPFFNFNSALNYGFAVVPDSPINGLVPSPQGVLFNWYGNLTQDGTGQIVLGGTATNGKGLDYAFGGKNTFVGGTPPMYQLESVDLSQRTTLNIVAKTLPANQTKTLGIGLFDIRGNASLYTFSLEDLNTSSYTTLQINLLAPTIDLTGPDGQQDLTKISGWVFGGDQGTINLNQNIPLGFMVDEIFATGRKNSEISATGTVSLGGAALDLQSSPSLVPTAGQQFTLISNDAADAVSGTFAGLAEGANVSIGGHTFQISYVGGTGNDVVLTEVSPILDLNGASSSGTSYTTEWNKLLATPVNITSNTAATVEDNGTTLTSMTVTISNPNAGDVLAANVSGTLVSASYNGSNTLFLTGTDSVANYQTVLRKITYNNTSGGPGVPTVSFSFVASDGVLTSAPVTATITNINPVVDLNGAAGGTAATATWFVAGGPILITAADATVADVDDINLVALTATIANPRAGDVLAANTSGTSITASWNGSNVLTLSGTDTEANYQTVLRTITYNNSGDPGSADALIDFAASDGVAFGTSSRANVIINLPLRIDLEGATGGNDGDVWWTGRTPIPIAAATAGSTVTDTVISGGDGSPELMTFQISNPNTGDVLAANTTGTSITASYDAPTFKLYLTGADSPANYQTVLRTITYNNTAGGPGNQGAGNVHQKNILGNLQDGSVNARQVTARVKIIPVVDLNSNLADAAGGTFAGAGPDVVTTWTTGGGAVAITDTDAALFDGARANLLYMTVSIENFVPGHGDVLTVNTTGTSLSSAFLTGVLTLSHTTPGTTVPQADFQTVLRTIRYNNTLGGSGAHNPIVVRFMADNDGQADASKSWLVDANGEVITSPLNQPPNQGNTTLPKASINIVSPIVVDLNGAAGGLDTIGTWNETGAVDISDPANATVTYAGSLTSMTVSIVQSPSNGSAAMHSGDILTVTTSGGITSSFNGVTGVLTLSGTASPAAYQTVLRTVKYNNTSPSGGPGATQVYIDVVGKDGTTAVSNAAEASLNIVRPDRVDLDGPGGNNNFTTTWTGGLVNLTDTDATVTDGESPNLTSVSISIGGLPNPSNGLGVNVDIPLVDENITASGIGTSTILLTGTDTLANYEYVLRTVQYFNSGSGPGVPTLTITFSASDGIGSNTLSFTTLNIAVPPALDLNGAGGGTGYTSTWTNAGAVSITDGAAATVIEGDGSNLTSMTASIVGGQNPGDVLSATTVGSITASYNSGTGVLTLSGTDTPANYQSVLRSIKYNNTVGNPGDDPVLVDIVGIDAQGNSATVQATIDVNLPLNSTVVGRRIFYNQSGTASPLRYDGNNAAINSNDDLAIATDKVAYLPGAGVATFANVTGFSKGINGIMIDILGAHGTMTAADFIFRVGNNNSPSLWATAPAPTAMSVRATAGTSGSDRLEIIWANNAIQKTWLQVVTKANANTGLAQLAGYTAGYGDVFYFGNALGNSGLGDTATLSTVNATDELGARANPASVFANIPITNIYDYNRDAAVNATDQLISRGNPTGLATATKYLNIGVGSGPNAPEGDGGDAGVASALAAPATSTTPDSSGWLASSLAAASVDSGSTAAALAQIVAEDATADSSAQEDSELDALLAEMGL